MKHRQSIAALCMLLSALGVASCEHLSYLRDYGASKAQRLAECQAKELTKEQARECLGEFAKDLHTDACQEAEGWIETLPEGRPNK